MLFPRALPFVLAAAPASAQLLDVVGVKSCGSSPGVCGNVASTDPAHLFTFRVDGSALTDLGELRYADGTSVDVDGLAVVPSIGLVGFVLDHDAGATESTFAGIDPATAIVTPLGAPLALHVRGAGVGPVGMWILDADTDILQRFDPSSGLPIAGTATGLHVGGAPLNLSDGCDLAARDDGRLVVVDNDSIYEVDPLTGAAVLLRSEPGRFFPGAAFSSAAPADGLFAYEVNGKEDVDRFDLDTPGVPKTPIYADLLPSFNAGRGDLASLSEFPAAACTVRNGNGLNPLDYQCASLPRLGSTWQSAIATPPGTVGTIVAIAPGGPNLSMFPPVVGELLIQVVPFPTLDFQNGAHAFPIPAQPTLSGVVVATQGLRLELTPAPIVRAMNAIDLTLGS